MKNLLFAAMALVLVLFTNITFSQTPENTKNKFDYLGVIHNEVLKEFFKQNSTPNMSIEEILKKIEPIILENKNYSERFGKEYNSITVEQIKHYMPDIANNFNSVVEDQNISSEAKLYLKELLNSLEGATDFSKVYQSVISFEERVSQSKLSNSEKEIILGSSSIARYSSFLWLVENPKPTFYNSLSARWRWWTLVADIAGGILGAGGSIPGIAAGAAAVSAVSEAISTK